MKIELLIVLGIMALAVIFAKPDRHGKGHAIVEYLYDVPPNFGSYTVHAGASGAVTSGNSSVTTSGGAGNTNMSGGASIRPEGGADAHPVDNP